MADGTITKTYYVHSQPYEDSYCGLWDNDAPQQEVIHGLLYEEAVEVEIDRATGKWRYLSFAGSPLEHPTDWFPA